MTKQDNFPFENPLFKAAPTLQKAMFPNLNNFNHDQALLACFEALAFMNNTNEKPSLHPLARTVEEVVEKMAGSCGFMPREINIHNMMLTTETNPAIAFMEETSNPGLIYYKDEKPYVYDPATGTNKLLDEALLKNYQTLGFVLYKKWPQKSKTIAQMLKMAYRETHKDLKRFIIIQICVGIVMLLQPLLTGIIFDDVVKLRQYSLIDQVFFGLLSATIGVMAFKVVQNFSMMRFHVKSSAYLESALWHRVLTFPLKFFKIYRLGDLHERLVAVDQIQKELTTASMNALSQGFFSIIILIFISVYMPLLGLVLLGLTLIFGIIRVLLTRRMIIYYRSITQTNAKLMSFLFEAIRSVIKVKTSNSQKRIFQRWLNMEFSKTNHLIGAQYLLVYSHILEFVVPIIITVSFYFLMIGNNPLAPVAPALSIGKFISLQMAMGQYFAAIIGMIGVIDKLLHLIPHVERVGPILKIPGEQDGIKKIQTFLKGKITFQNVSFNYGSTGPLVLDNVSFTINPGEWVAIVGPSGAGKSTLVKLILGLEECISGTILLDDIPLQQLDMQTIRRQVATVLQNTQLLPGSIFDNLHASNPNLSEQEMMALLSLVAIKDDVTKMPMGLSTVIMGDGRTFSMGQRQRLVLARCLAKPLSLILLDEATSALDNFSQDVILNTLKQLPITRITVAHRSSTIRCADRIIHLEQGKVVDKTEENNKSILSPSNPDNTNFPLSI
ncbi:MAG: ATP-binding cassette domain-containing protein [Alphaproteobacteria bacterium]|nr:ATP-binding cassette domain-containing protein [Alphaproteobacteria bacterium]